MGRISKLDSKTVNMIAAGEVVERPMGVVKELIENAIDAGSTRIVINIENGGLTKITIQDNGCGMDARDAEMCFERHATSKINNTNDLWAIRTLGFRGEALPSIAAVAKVTLITSDGNDATKIVMEYGNVKSASSYPCSQGTEISVEGLFYHTPARLKHMRSAAYEASLIQDVIVKAAFSHPEIAFRFINEGRDSFRTDGQNDLLQVVYAVYGKSVAENTLKVDFSDFDYHVSGYLVKPDMTRASRNMMHIFLNGRMVRTFKLFKSIQEAYEEFIPKGRYPMCVLMIETDPHLLDVNVHPSKWEVRISKEIQLELLLKEEISKALRGNDLVVRKEVHEIKVDYYEPISFMEQFNKTEEVRKEILKEAAEDNAVLKQLHEKIEEPVIEYDEKPDPIPQGEVIGQYKNRYILLEADNGLMLIDQKAAQARVIYEQLLKTMDHTVMNELLIPIRCHVGESLAGCVDEINAGIRDMRIEFEVFGKDELIVRSVPAWMKELNEQEILEDILDAYRNEKQVKRVRFDKERLARISSRKSIHVSQKLSMDEMKNLYAQLRECENSRSDPSGRPIMILLDEKELAKEFTR